MLVFLALSWASVALYPDPMVLVHSVQNIVHPRIQPRAVAAIAARLPDDPKKIEAYVLEHQVPYAYDWQSAGVPWYFPTATDVLRQGVGDCESRAIMLASLLAAKHIPYHLSVSFDHIWVDYPGKQANALENPRVQIAGTRNGHFFIRWPAYLNLRQEWADQVAMYWTPAPIAERVLLFGGLCLIALWNALAGLLALGRRGLVRTASRPGELLPGAGPAPSRRARRRRGARRAPEPRLSRI